MKLREERGEKLREFDWESRVVEEGDKSGRSHGEEKTTASRVCVCIAPPSCMFGWKVPALNQNHANERSMVGAGGRGADAAGRAGLLASVGQPAAVAGLLRPGRPDAARRRHHRRQRGGLVEPPLQAPQGTYHIHTPSPEQHFSLVDTHDTRASMCLYDRTSPTTFARRVRTGPRCTARATAPRYVSCGITEHEHLVLVDDGSRTCAGAAADQVLR